VALSAPDALTISGYLKAHAGAAPGSDNTNCVAIWIRSRWGASGSDSQVIAKYAESLGDSDLVAWADNIRKHGDGRA
jgi:hypothetical protein